MIFPLKADFREIVRAGILGCDVTTADAKAAKVIWGCLVLEMIGNTVRRNAKYLVQSVIKVPKELIKLQQDVERFTSLNRLPNFYMSMGRQYFVFLFHQSTERLHQGDMNNSTSTPRR
jgi:hypothetical protein